MVDCHWLKLPSCNTVIYGKEAVTKRSSLCAVIGGRWWTNGRQWTGLRDSVKIPLDYSGVTQPFRPSWFSPDYQNSDDRRFTGCFSLQLEAHQSMSAAAFGSFMFPSIQKTHPISGGSTLLFVLYFSQLWSQRPFQSFCSYLVTALQHGGGGVQRQDTRLDRVSCHLQMKENTCYILLCNSSFRKALHPFACKHFCRNTALSSRSHD